MTDTTIPEGYKIIPGLEHLMINGEKNLKSISSGKDIPIVRLSSTGIPLYRIQKNNHTFVRDAEELYSDAFDQDRRFRKKRSDKARA